MWRDSDKFLKRPFDIILSSVLIIILIIPMLFIGFIIKLSSSGSILYWSKRVGINETFFLMPKFRTMKKDTPAVATHLLGDIDDRLTFFGKILRKTSLDELPQLFTILKGDMSFVGPRPALYNQDDLITLRREYGIHKLMPGLTGWAQINGRDSLPIAKKVNFEAEYLDKKSFLFDIKIIFLTFLKAILIKDISH